MSGEIDLGARALHGGNHLRILAVSATWQGANDYAFVRAFRRLGHSVRVVSEMEFSPQWVSKPMRVIRKIITNQIVAEFNAALLDEARTMRPDLLFVFKGPLVKAETIADIRSMGTVAMQFYPDVSFHTHGRWLPDALRQYDWVFTTKTFGLDDMEAQLGVKNASFLPHTFDPETHTPTGYDKRDVEQYSCDVSFIGNSSRKKVEFLSHVVAQLPNLDIKVWGPIGWKGFETYQGRPVFGAEYAKAIGLSRINVGLLSEKAIGSSSGDKITARTFEIPAAGGFMLHERTNEVGIYFKEDREFAAFGSPIELTEKIQYYIVHEDERRAIASAGRERCIRSGYSVDDRAREVLKKFFEIK